MRKLLTVCLVLATGCYSAGQYHVESAPMGAKPIWPQVVDVLLKNDCAPLITYYTHGVHRDSVTGHLYYGQHTTVRIPRKMFEGPGAARLTLMVDAYQARDGSGYIGSASQSWYVDTWSTGQDPDWKVNQLQSPTYRNCPRA